MARRIDTSNDLWMGNDWTGRLDEWLRRLAANDPYGREPQRLEYWSFPTGDLHDEYISTIGSRTVEEVEMLLRWFLFDASTFGADRRGLDWAVRRANDESVSLTEYDRRLLTAGRTPAHPGVRWVVDLVGIAPQTAIGVVEAYLGAHAQVLPDGRLAGLSDALDVMRAWYVEREQIDAREALRRFSPRDLEYLAARLYKQLGYEAELTSRGNDGGRDVVARRTSSGTKATVLIECKHYAGTVGVPVLRGLLGAVTHERATSGVVLTSGKFSRPAQRLAATDDRLDLVDGTKLIRLLNESYGTSWISRHDWSLEF